MFNCSGFPTKSSIVGIDVSQHVVSLLFFGRTFRWIQFIDSEALKQNLYLDIVRGQIFRYYRKMVKHFMHTAPVACIQGNGLLQ